MKALSIKQMVTICLCSILCLSVISCQNEAEPSDTKYSDSEPYKLEISVTKTTMAETTAITEADMQKTDFETEELTSITDIVTDPIPMVDSLQIVSEYLYTDLPEITGQTSNPNIFTTADAETPFLYFGENGLVPCEVEITEYPVSLTLGGVTVSDVYREYSYAGKVFYPSTQTSGGLLAGSLFDIYTDRNELRVIHKVGDEIICELTHCGIHILVIYHIDQKSFTALHSGQSPETVFYDTLGQLRTLPCYVTAFLGMSPMRDYMIYAMSERYGESDMDYYLYQFKTHTTTLVCDEGFAADSYYGGTAGESAYWLDDRTCRIDLENDFGNGIHEFYDVFVADDCPPQIKAYSKEEACSMAFDKNDSLYRLCYRFDFHDDGGVISHLYDDMYSVKSSGLTQETFYQLFDKEESYSDFFGHSLNNGYQAKVIGKNLLFQHFLIYNLYDIGTWSDCFPELRSETKQIYPITDGFLVIVEDDNEAFRIRYHRY